MNVKLTGVLNTVARAEVALKKIITEGSKISQHAVEKKAGLANGALNYNCPEYREFRNVIKLAAENRNKANAKLITSNVYLQQQIKLKGKYRVERNELRRELKIMLAEIIELHYHLALMQNHIAELEKSALAGKTVFLKN